MHLVQICQPSLGKGPQEIKRSRGLVIGLQQALWIRRARCRGKRDGIDHVSPVTRQRDAVNSFHF